MVLWVWAGLADPYHQQVARADVSSLGLTDLAVCQLPTIVPQFFLTQVFHQCGSDLFR